MLEPKDEGVTHIQKPRPGEFDVVLSSHPSRAAQPQAGGAGRGRLLIYVAVLGLAAWLLAPQLFTSKPAASTPAPVAAASEAEPAEPAPAPVAQPVAQRIDISLPDPQPAVAAPAPSPAPKPLLTTPTNMVSAQYMADYKSGANRPVNTRHKTWLIASATIREWDGRNAYRAQWRISDNVIDNASVCANFYQGSVERRECRRAAQVYFREQCKDWGRRVEKNNDEEAKTAQSRYCSATKSFSPDEG
ncbi:hypothetical protein SFA35_24565 [Pseudomonas sp. HR96]|uniref:hypothetical protein n=1 Tax=Pseudomonas sp. HR96 TaxID=1027966 RepID=UPI002A74EBE5|nr:hypothetical protein [Pseudomonas sp. HR96]WPO99730.1 hypothetical protein SFA35_24565 [Pseudomonas sp. HR96]